MMPDLIGSTVSLLRYDTPTFDVHIFLLERGLSDYEAWLTVKAAEVHLRLQAVPTESFRQAQRKR